MTTDSAPPTETESDVPTANSSGTPTLSDSALRMSIASWLRASLYDDRDLYTTFDWPSVGGIDVEQYYATYTRHPFAKPVVDRPAFTTWRDDPEIIDDADGDETDFEADVRQANRELDLWSYAERLDRLAGIGRFGVLVWITSDIESPSDLEDPLDPMLLAGQGLDAVNQIKVFSEVSVDGIGWGGIEAAEDGRWGKPVHYSIDFSPEADTDSDRPDQVYDVHWTRTIAVPASRLLDDDFFGRPRLESVINTLRDIEKVLGSVAELAYRGADKGLAISYDPEKVNVTSEEFWEQNDEELQEWHHGLKHVLETVGDVHELGGQIADATGIFEPQLSALAAATGIPKRVFEGDPAGALASAKEDTQAYFGQIEERRNEYATPHIARPVLGWLVRNGIISQPTDGFGTVDVDWPALRVLSEKEQAELANERLEHLHAAVTVAEARDLHGLEPQPEWMPDEVANAYLAEMRGSGGVGGPGEALEAALSDNRKKAQAAARNAARIKIGAEADN